jgi:hypothetical protein
MQAERETGLHLRHRTVESGSEEGHNGCKGQADGAYESGDRSREAACHGHRIQAEPRSTVGARFPRATRGGRSTPDSVLAPLSTVARLSVGVGWCSHG